MPYYKSQELIQGIVNECHAQFSRLPKHGKPAKKSNGQAEWTILAGIVLVTPADLNSGSNIGGSSESTSQPKESWEVECISLATGSKCLPLGKLSPRGDLLNDCHAEVLARRGFNSQAPCGDATTGSLAQIQTAESKNVFLSGQQGQTLKAEAPVHWLENDKCHDQVSPTAAPKRRRASEEHQTLDLPVSKQPKLEALMFDSKECGHALDFRRGRIDYDSVGVLRTKPGRVDSEPTASMSCSDKIARWNVLGLTSALVIPFLLKPIYLHSITTRELFDLSALERALYKRIQHCGSCINSLAAPNIPENPKGSCEEFPYQPHRIKIYESTEAFEFSKEAIAAKVEQDANVKPPIPCPSSISWIASEPSITEVLVNGCKAGASSKQPIQLKSRSRLCKISMYETSVALWQSLSAFGLGYSNNTKLVQRMIDLNIADERALESDNVTYRQWKALANDYSTAKERLFQGVFRNWIRYDKTLEMFDVKDKWL
ncbi:tRNA-specific adenosine deaminase 1 [Mortierella sp. AM989]|nr:tRNA-specific adenosine deaminase 1 [Mortierella sp. AM989]